MLDSWKPGPFWGHGGPTQIHKGLIAGLIKGNQWLYNYWLSSFVFVADDQDDFLYKDYTKLT